MHITVVGAGTMGAGIAQALIQHKIQTSLTDLYKEQVQRAESSIKGSLDKLVQRGKLEAKEADEIFSCLTVLEKREDFLEQVKDSDMVIEATAEDLKIKRALFLELDPICKKTCVFASNTSSLEIAKIAEGLAHEASCLGLHFFNPAPRMRLVEVIGHAKTQKESLDLAINLVSAMDKEAVLCADAPGFVVNRLLIPMINEAAEAFSEEVASAADIDKAMQLGAMHPMGPLALADLIGLDIVLAILKSLEERTGKAKYHPAQILETMVQEGHLGRKTGQGFHSYQKN